MTVDHKLNTSRSNTVAEQFSWDGERAIQNDTQVGFVLNISLFLAKKHY